MTAWCSNIAPLVTSRTLYVIGKQKQETDSPVVLLSLMFFTTILSVPCTCTVAVDPLTLSPRDRCARYCPLTRKWSVLPLLTLCPLSPRDRCALYCPLTRKLSVFPLSYYSVLSVLSLCPNALLPVGPAWLILEGQRGGQPTASL